MKLEEMPIKDLLALHNRIADKPAGPKTFATRAKLIARIEQIAADKDIDLSSSGQPKKPKAAARRAEPKAPAAEAPEAAEKKPRGLRSEERRVGRECWCSARTAARHSS